MPKTEKKSQEGKSEEPKFKDLSIEQQIEKLVGDTAKMAKIKQTSDQLLDIAKNSILSDEQKKLLTEQIQNTLASDSDSSYRGADATFLFNKLSPWLPENKTHKQFDAALGWFIGYSQYQSSRLKTVRSKSNATVSTDDEAFAKVAAQALGKLSVATAVKNVKDAIKSKAPHTKQGKEGSEPIQQFEVGGKKINAGTIAAAFSKILKQRGEFGGFKFDKSTKQISSI